MRFSFEETPEAISAQYLQEPDQHIAIVLSDEPDPVYLFDQYPFDGIHIIFQQTVFPGIGQLGFGLPEQAGDIVLQGALHSALVIDEMYFAGPEHDIAALEVPEHEEFIVDMG